MIHLRRAVNIAGLAAFAISQPLFSFLTANGEFLVTRRVEPATLLLLTALIGLGVPFVAAAVAALGAIFSKRAGDVVYATLAGFLAFFIALPVLLRWDCPDVPALILAGVAAHLVGFGALRSGILHLYLGIASVSLVLFPLFFLLSPVAGGILSKRDAATAMAVSTEPRRDLSTVLVVLDELPFSSLLNPQGEIDSERFPGFAALGHEATVYRNARTHGIWTHLAVQAIVTGTPTETNAVGKLVAPTGTLFEVFHAAALPVTAFETQTQLCREEINRHRRDTTQGGEIASLCDELFDVYRHQVLPRRWRVLLPNMADKAYRSAGAQEQFGEFIEKVTADPSGFHFLCCERPHRPWEYLPSGRLYSHRGIHELPGMKQGGLVWTTNALLVAQGYRRHLYQVQFVDRCLQRLVDELKRLGRYDSTLLIVMADHGINFVPGKDCREVLPENPATVLNIPLLIKWPGRTNGVICDCPVDSIDVAPTIASVMSLTLPWPVMGNRLTNYGDGHRCVPETTTDWAAGREDAVRRKHGWPKPFADLIGRSLDQCQLGSPAVEPVLRLDQLISLRCPVRDSGYLPCHITGRVLGDAPADGVPLAVAINGVIADVGATYTDSGGTIRPSLVVPEESIAHGTNELAVFRVDDVEGHCVLRPLALPDLEATATGAGGAALSLPIRDGLARQIPLVPGIATGVVTTLDWGRDLVEISGWAYDPVQGESVESIEVFLDGRHYYSGTTPQRLDGQPPPGVPERARVGFCFYFPPADLGRPAPDRLRIYAVSAGGMASELVYRHPERKP